MKISVLTPCFNSVKYIHRAIESVVKQDYKDWEHIVIDGGSKDGTVELLKRYSQIKWVSESDRGQSDAMNKAFRIATGDLMIYLNADDELNENAMTQVVRVMKAHPLCDIVVGNLMINQSGNLSIRKPSIRLVDILDYWPCRFPRNPVSYAYKRQLQLKVGPFPLDNHYTMDYWFLLRAYLFGRIIKIDESLGTFHLHEKSKSADIERAKSSLRSVRNDFLMQYFYRPEVLFYFLRKIKGQVRKLFK